MYHYCTIAALFFSSKHGGKIWNLLPYRDERGRNRKKAHARQEIFPGRRCGVSTRPARLSLQTQRMAGAKAKGESAPGRESEPQSGSDPMRGNEPEAGICHARGTERESAICGVYRRNGTKYGFFPRRCACEVIGPVTKAAAAGQVSRSVGHIGRIFSESRPIIENTPMFFLRIGRLC